MNYHALPHLLIVMGVSGSGKSTLSEVLAKKIAYTYLDADDFHSAAAKERMAKGFPLNDEMRAPWIKAMHDFFTLHQNDNTSYVLAYSGLKLQHREVFRTLPYKVRFVYLSGCQDLILKRLQKREDHFFDANLLDSQFIALEEPCENELNTDTTIVNIDSTLSQQQAFIIDELSLKYE